MPTGVDRTVIGTILDNYTTVALPSATQATITLTVPLNRRWWVFGGQITNGDAVARNCKIEVFNQSAQLIQAYLVSSSITTGLSKAYPNALSTIGHTCVDDQPLKAGDYMLFTFAAGAAGAGGTGSVSAIVQEVVV